MAFCKISDPTDNLWSLYVSLTCPHAPAPVPEVAVALYFGLSAHRMFDGRKYEEPVYSVTIACPPKQLCAGPVFSCPELSGAGLMGKSRSDQMARAGRHHPGIDVYIQVFNGNIANIKDYPKPGFPSLLSKKAPEEKNPRPVSVEKSILIK